MQEESIEPAAAETLTDSRVQIYPPAELFDPRWVLFTPSNIQ